MKQFKIDYTIVGLLLVALPLLFLALKVKDTRERFAASQGGVLVQLASSRVMSEDEVREYQEQNKRQVVQDILDMTEPEGRPGPMPMH
jgi:hypothetical protein